MFRNDVFEQTCADYLRHLGIEIADGQRTNAPYRPDADSESFVINGPLFYDHSHGTGGNVWQLALAMTNNDRREALRSLCAAKGVPFIEHPRATQLLTDQDRAKAALAKVYAAFAINDQTPSSTLE